MLPWWYLICLVTICSRNILAHLWSRPSKHLLLAQWLPVFNLYPVVELVRNNHFWCSSSIVHVPIARQWLAWRKCQNMGESGYFSSDWHLRCTYWISCIPQLSHTMVFSRRIDNSNEYNDQLLNHVGTMGFGSFDSRMLGEHNGLRYQPDKIR